MTSFGNDRSTFSPGMNQQSTHKEEQPMLRRKYTRPVTITLEESIFERIKTITDHGDISISEWIREAIDSRMFQEMRESGQEQPTDIVSG